MQPLAWRVFLILRQPPQSNLMASASAKLQILSRNALATQIASSRVLLFIFPFAQKGRGLRGGSVWKITRCQGFRTQTTTTRLVPRRWWPHQALAAQNDLINRSTDLNQQSKQAPQAANNESSSLIFCSMPGWYTVLKIMKYHMNINPCFAWDTHHSHSKWLAVRSKGFQPEKAIYFTGLL